MSFRRQVLSYTPVLDGGIAYASADVLALAAAVVNVVPDKAGCARLESLVVIDKANNKQSFDIIFFDQAPANSLGALNAAYTLNDADGAKVLGRISVLTTDYVSSASANAEATLRSLDLILKAAAGSTSIYVALVCRSGTPTYALGDLILRFGVDQG